MEKGIVFYSWQSDLPGKMNRSLIESALERAVEALADDADLSITPMMDRDTQGVPGSPDIGQTILAKIADSAAFVCDVSFINPLAEGKRLTPNPNVLFELGYALRALGWERVVMVFNTATGRVEDLPFDLRQKRALTYESAENDPGRAPPRTELTNKLVAALREILLHSRARQPEETLASKAIGAIRAGTPDAAACVGDYMTALSSWVADERPEAKQGIPDEEALVEALNGSIEVVTEFVAVAEEVARHGHTEAALRLFQGFEGILLHYSRPPRTGGVFRTVEFDFAKVLGHELFTCLAAVLLRHGRTESLGDLLRATLTVDRDDGYVAQRYWLISAAAGSLDLYFRRRNQNLASPQAELLKERHSGDGDLAQAVSWRLFIETDYLLFLRSAFELAEGEHPFGRIWMPWSYPYLEEVGTPRWLAQAASRRSLEALCRVFDVQGADEFRKRYVANATLAGKMFPNSYGFDPRLLPATELGSKP